MQTLHGVPAFTSFRFSFSVRDQLIRATPSCGRGITCTLTTSPTRPAASAPASTAARTAATSPLSVIATSPLPTLCWSTKVTLAAFSAASHASTAATIPFVSINPIASPFAMTSPVCVLSALLTFQNFHGLPRHDQFFVGWHDPYLRPRLHAADSLFRSPHRILVLVQLDPRPPQIPADGLANLNPVLANAAGERERLAPAQGHQVRPDEMPHRLDERLDRQLRPRVPRRRGLLDIPHVRRHAAHPEHAAFLAKLPED